MKKEFFETPDLELIRLNMMEILCNASTEPQETGNGDNEDPFDPNN